MSPVLGRRRRRRYLDWKKAGKRMQVTRLALGLSEADMAERLGVTIRTYRRYEAGGRPRFQTGLIDFGLEVCDGELLNWHVGAYTNKTISSPGSRVAILGVRCARLRHIGIAHQICAMLPRDEKNARAVLDDVRKIWKSVLFRRRDMGQVVSLRPA